MSTEERSVAATLYWCNERRVEKGMEMLERLPKGKREDPFSCPCGKATGLHVGEVYWSDPDSGATDNLPTLVRHFVDFFDRGKFPQYEEGRDDL